MTADTIAASAEVESLLDDLQARRMVAGQYQDELDAGCPHCGSWAGWVCREGGRPCPPHRERQAALVAQRETQATTERLERAASLRLRLEAADVPAGHILALEQLLETEPLAKARAWRAAGERSLVLLGARGVGKSGAAAWAIGQGPARATPGYPPAVWVMASELAAFDLYGESRLDGLRRCGLLVVDEFGGGEVGDPTRFRARVAGLMCVRHDRALDTIITSNMSVDEFRDAIDTRVVDRIRSSGTVYSCKATTSLRTGRDD